MPKVHAGQPNALMSVAAWPLDAGVVAGRSFRHFRIVQTGASSSAVTTGAAANRSGTYVLACTGIELYGVLTDTSG